MAYTYFIHYQSTGKEIRSSLLPRFENKAFGQYICRSKADAFLKWLQKNPFSKPYFCFYFLDIRNGCPNELREWLANQQPSCDEFILFRIQDGVIPPATNAHHGSIQIMLPRDGRAFRALLLRILKEVSLSQQKIDDILRDGTSSLIAPTNLCDLQAKYSNPSSFLREHIKSSRVPRDAINGNWSDYTKRNVFLDFTRCIEGMIHGLEEPDIPEKGRAQIRVLQSLWRYYRDGLLAQETNAVENLDKDIESYHTLNQREQAIKLLLHFDSTLKIQSDNYKSTMEEMNKRLLRYNLDLPELQSSDLLYLPYGDWDSFWADLQNEQASEIWILVHYTDVSQQNAHRLDDLIGWIQQNSQNGWPKLGVYESNGTPASIQDLQNMLDEKDEKLRERLKAFDLQTQLKGKESFFRGEDVWT